MPEDFDELKSFFFGTMKVASPDKPLVVILDSLDQLSKEHNAYKLNWLPQKLPANVYFFVSTYTEALDLIQTLKLICKTGTFINVPTFSEELSGQVVKSWLEKKDRTLTTDQYAIVQEVFKKCSLPLFVKLTYDQVLSWRSYTPVDKCVLMYTVQESIERLFTQLEKKHGPVLVQRALSYVTASVSGISESELEDLLSLDDIVLTDVYQRHIPPFRRIPPLLWVRIRHDISQYLVDKEVDEVRSFFWYHRQFFEAANSRYLSDKAFKKEIHGLMADYYLGTWYGVMKPFKYTPEQMKRLKINSPDSEADRKISAQPLTYQQAEDNKEIRYNKRKLNKLPFHLYQAGRTEELLSTCLYNLEWIVTKTNGVSLRELIADYVMLGEKNGILHKTLKAAYSTLRKYPETVAMEISGRLLALLRTKPEKHEKKLLEETVDACARDCKLVPYLPCYSIPSESELYCFEHPKLPFDPNISEICSKSTHFAVLAEENTALILDLKAGELETQVTLPSHVDVRMNVIVKPARKDYVVIASCHQKTENPVFIINLDTGALEYELKLEKVYTKALFSDTLQFDMTNSCLLVNVKKQAADVFDLKTGKLLHEFEGEPEEAGFVSEEMLIVTRPKQTNLYNLYRSDNYELVYQVSCLATPKCLYVDSSTNFGCIIMENSSLLQFLNLQQGPKLGQTEGKVEANFKSKILHLVLGHKIFMVVSLEGFVLYDSKSLKKVREIIIPEKYKPGYRVLDFQAMLTPDALHIIAGYDSHLIIWDVKTGYVVNSLEVSKSRITELLMAPSGEYVVTKNSRNNQIKTWSVASLKTKARSYQPLSLSNSVRYMCVNRAGNVAVLRSLNSTEFAVIDIPLGEKRCEISHEFEAMMPFVTEDGRYAVIREYNSENCLKVWDTVSGGLVSSIPVSSLHLKAYILGTQPKNMVVLTTDDTTLVNIVTFYELPSAAETGIKIHLGQFTMMQIFFAMNDKYILVGIEEQLHPGINIFTRAYDVTTGQEVNTFPRMHPQKIQPITPESDCFLGQRIHTDENGVESWELVVINIETGQDMMKCADVPSSVLHVGHLGHFGIDRDKNIYDIKKGKKCFRFDPECPYKKATPKPKLTFDEKFALWIDLKHGMLKIGSLATQKIVGQVPTHSIIMNLEVTPANIVLMGCEDGRLMMLQIATEKADSIITGTMSRSMKKAVKVRDSVLKAMKVNDGGSSKAGRRTENSGKSKMCVLA